MNNPFVKRAYKAEYGDDLRTIFYDKMVGNGRTPPEAMALASMLSKALGKHSKNPDMWWNSSSLPRSKLDQELFSKDVLQDAGFLDSVVAVPERGQRSIFTLRHPYTGMHLHDHQNDWMFHDDKWPSLSMVKEQFRQENPDASDADVWEYTLKHGIKKSLPHVVYEGIPGYTNYVYNTMRGSPTISEKSLGMETNSPLSQGLNIAGSSLGVGGLAALAGLGLDKIKGDGSYTLNEVSENLLGGAGAAGSFALSKALSGKLQNKLVDSGVSSFEHPGLPSLLLSTGIPIAAGVGGLIGGRKLGDMLVDDTEEEARKKKERENEGAPQLKTASNNPFTQTIKMAGYSYGTTQLTFRPSDAKKFIKACFEIEDGDLYVDDDPGKYGRESEPHITVLYGLHKTPTHEVAEHAAHRRPIRVKLGKITRFESKDYDVLKVDVKSTPLHSLHNALRGGVNNSYKFPDYKPHVTLAYVEKGAAKDLDDDDRFEGKKYTFDRLTYRRKSGYSVDIQFSGSKVNPYTKD